MRILIPLILLVMVAAPGCLLGEKQSIKLESEIVPNKVSLEEPESLSLEAKVSNVGKNTVTITVDIIGDEGLEVSKPPRTTFTIKPGGSRIVIFNATLAEDAVPGDYIIDVTVTTDKGERITGVAKLRVVQKKGII
jgi:uncharacterized membrane protein